LEIEVLDTKNMCLLSKWLFKMLNKDGVWQEPLQTKYLLTKTLYHVEAKPTDSLFLQGAYECKR
jgi:hypothetical protein